MHNQLCFLCASVSLWQQAFSAAGNVPFRVRLPSA